MTPSPLFKLGASKLLLLAAATGMLSWVALLNMAPLVFSDSITYLVSAWNRELPGFFSIFYSIYILPLHLGRTFWLVVVVQGAILAHALYVTLRCTSRELIKPSVYLAIIAATCAFSGAPWITGQLLPDFFSPVVLLSIYLTGFCRRQLSFRESTYFTLLLVAAITTHLSHVPIAAGLCASVVVLCLIFNGSFRPTLAAGLFISGAIAVAVATMVLMTAFASGRVGLAKNSNVFLLAKFLGEGHAIRYLRETCTTKQYTLCAVVDELEGKSHDELKWHPDSPLRRFEFDALEAEAQNIVLGTVRNYPGPIIQSALSDAFAQLRKFQTGDGLSPEYAKLVAYHVGAVYGADLGAPFRMSKLKERFQSGKCANCTPSHSR